MGYDRTADLPVWRLVFDEHPGLVVRVGPPSVAGLAAGYRAVPLINSGRERDAIAAVRILAAPFADAVVSWTLEQAGRPVPVRASAVLRLDLQFALKLIAAWIVHAFTRSRSTAEPASAMTPEARDEPSEVPEVELGLPMSVLDPQTEQVAG